MTKIINLADLKREPLVSIVDMDGKKHDMVSASVETFIENATAISGLALDAGPVAELNVIVGIVARAFPSLTEKAIRKWPIDIIQQLSNIARGVNGEVASTDEKAIEEANASGNVPAAS